MKKNISMFLCCCIPLLWYQKSFFRLPSSLWTVASLSLSLGAATVIPSPVSYSQSDESRDHPEAAGTKLWSNGKHQQLPQPLCAAAHQRQVRSLLLYLCFHISKGIIFFAFNPPLDCSNTTLHRRSPAHPSSSLLSTCSHTALCHVF